MSRRRAQLDLSAIHDPPHYGFYRVGPVMFNGFEDAHSGDIVCGNLGPQVKRQEERLARASRIQIFNVRLQNKLPHDFRRRQWRDFPEYVLRVDGKAPRQVGARLKQIEESVVRYMSQLDTADRHAAAGGDG